MIYLLRHGDAEDDTGEGDAARELTSKGEAQARLAGRAIARLEFHIDAVLTSPRVRALRTAELVCESLELMPEIEESIGDGAYDAMDLASTWGDVLIVGHEPTLSMEVARLTGASIKMKKGGLAVLEPASLKALLRPAELAAIAAR